MRIGLYIDTDARAPLDGVLDRFERAEALGFHTAWAGHVFVYDALCLLALAGPRTARIELGSWVVPLYGRHPAALAQQTLTVSEACGGRLALGVGVSHRAVVEKRLGLDYARPLRHARECLAVLGPLLAGQRVEHTGPELRVALQLKARVAPPPVLLGALGPRMLELAGEACDGAAIWLGGPRYLEEFALPRLRAGAERAGRQPRIACGLPVCVTTREAEARAAAEDFLARSSALPPYQRVLAREGAASPADVALIGDEAEIERRLAQLSGLGVTDFNAVPFAVAEDRGARARTVEALGDLARAVPQA